MKSSIMYFLNTVPYISWMIGSDIQEMYGTVFKKYMMDDFMHYMGIDKGWTIPFKGELEPRWMRQDATLMVNHSITKDAVQCRSCHTSQEQGIMPFEELGYAPA